MKQILANALIAFGLSAVLASGQSVKVGNKEIQVHGFFQQGFAISSGNNFLTMKTKDGSFSMTDGGINVSSRLSSKLRVGAQFFSRNVGDLGNGKVVLDWAFADYKFNDWIGIRAGKVKTTLGLFTDTQDMEFVHTWALLPQSVYPTDLRASTISHVGGDLYGEISLRKAGRLSYVLYGGSRPEDPRGGYFLGTKDAFSPIQSLTSWVKGSDVRWTGKVEGLTVGYSFYDVGGYGKSRLLRLNGQPLPVPGGIPYRYDLSTSHTNVVYGDYQRGKFRTYSELSLYTATARFSGVPLAPLQFRDRSWYVAGSYRIHKLLEMGSYYSEYRSQRDQPFNPGNGIRGPVVTARFDINRFWNMKAEGHFIEGYGEALSSRTFYRSSNPQGLVNRTNVFLVRSAFSF